MTTKELFEQARVTMLRARQIQFGDPANKQHWRDIEMEAQGRMIAYTITIMREAK